MFFLGHLGVGRTLVNPVSRGLKARWIFLGTVLPDLIDKPLYYGLSVLTGLRSAELGLVSGTRTFGHTGLFLIFLAAVAWLKKSRVLAALALGVATHLALDTFLDHLFHQGPANSEEKGMLLAVAFPFFGIRFPVMPFKDMGEHAFTFFRPEILWGELIGSLLLFWHYWRYRFLSGYPAAREKSQRGPIRR